MLKHKEAVITKIQLLVEKYGEENKICFFEKVTNEDLSMHYSARLFALHMQEQT